MNILDLIFPKRCLTCWRFAKYFCDGCAATIRVIQEREAVCPMCVRPAFGGAVHPRCKTAHCLDGLTSFFRYDGIVKEAVKTLKYRLVTDLAEEFIGLVPGSCLPPPQARDPVLIPIPLHGSRYRDRGFNQAEVLGRLLADRLHIPTRTDSLRRVKKTTPQVEMKDREERLRNMKNVFSILHSQFSIPHSVVLFDDVFTTGATMRAAGETLKRARVTSVWAVTMAR